MRTKSLLGVKQLTLAASHRDQVVELPTAAAVKGGNAFCPYGLLEYAEDRAISMQLHPEFDQLFAKALIHRRKGQLPGATREEALASLERPLDQPLAALWIADFVTLFSGR